MIDDDNSMDDSESLSWMTLKEQGKVAFGRGDYAAAIKKYSLALQPNRNCPAAERQILLSNMVAARLQIGGTTQAEVAVENAKQCVALNDRWAKGHVRLASAYIALGGHSNDACNALQRALQLDPNHPNARQMLLRELRREHATSRSNSTTSSASIHDSSPQPSAPPQQFDEREYSNRSSHMPQTQQEQQQQQHRPTRPPNNPYQDRPQAPLDDRISIQDRFLFYFHRARMWYLSLSDDARTLLMVVLGLLLLYVAFGGRFGLETIGRSSRHPRQRGNYHSGNAYDKYHEGHHRRSTNREKISQPGDYNSYHAQNHREQSYDEAYASHTSSYSSRSSHKGHHGHQHSHSGRDTHYPNDDNYYHTTQPPRQTTGSSFHMPNLFDGSLQSMVIVAAIVYACHRAGVNAMQVLFFMNVMNGGRRGHMGMFAYGGGRGGFGRRRW